MGNRKNFVGFVMLLEPVCKISNTPLRYVRTNFYLLCDAISTEKSFPPVSE